ACSTGCGSTELVERPATATKPPQANQRGPQSLRRVGQARVRAAATTAAPTPRQERAFGVAIGPASTGRTTAARGVRIVVVPRARSAGAIARAARSTGRRNIVHAGEALLGVGFLLTTPGRHPSEGRIPVDGDLRQPVGVRVVGPAFGAL